MKSTRWMLLLVSVLLLGSAVAQTPTQVMQKLNQVLNAHKHEFDYLLGDWEITLRNPTGLHHGYWGAIQLADGQIYDEYRLVNDKGETVYLTETVRAYNAVAEHWDLAGMDGLTGLQNVGTGKVQAGEVHIEQKFWNPTGNPAILRIHYHDIKPDSFLWDADRSLDNGKTWQLNVLHIDAKRIGAARAVAPLTPPKTAPAMNAKQ